MHTMTTHTPITRRSLLAQFVGAGLGSALPFAGLAQTPAGSSSPMVMADMHSHLGVVGRTRSPADLATEMRAHSATLVSWAVVADAPWLGNNVRGVVQTGEPTGAELWAFFEKTVATMRAYAEQNQLALVRTGVEVDAALAGRHSVVLASESAEFLSGDVSGLRAAFDLGIRQMQLVHYIRTPIGDASTSEPVHKGLSDAGRELVGACEALGILVDLSHCSAAAIDQALAASTKPLVWSHGWVHADSGSHRDSLGYLQRRLSMEQARKIAARGGVVGLWGLGVRQPNAGYWNVGLQDRAGYVREVVKLINLIGADHVAFGSDIAGMGSEWALNDYGHLREVVKLLEASKLEAATIEKVAYGNFARVLKATLPAA